MDAKASGFASADAVLTEFHKYGINLRKVDDNIVGISLNETTSLVDIDEVIEIFSGLKSKKVASGFNTEAYYAQKKIAELPENLKRTSSFMQQAQFTEITSETQMMRYI